MNTFTKGIIAERVANKRNKLEYQKLGYKAPTFVWAHDQWRGKPYTWLNEDGTRNNPEDSSDPELAAFYQGFMLGKASIEDAKYLIKEINRLNVELSKLTRNMELFSNCEEIKERA